MHVLSLHRSLFREVAAWASFLLPKDASGGAMTGSPMSAMDDGRLIERFLATEDADAFAILVDRYQSRVYRLVLSILGAGCAAESEEVTQDVFVKVFRQLARFRGESSFSTWLYRIAYREAVDARRRTPFRASHVDDSVLAEHPQIGPDPLDEAQDKERRLLVQLCLEALPDVYRSALYLHYWMGHSVEEMTELLAVPAGTVKSYLHRGRRLLLREMEKRGSHALL